MVWKAFEIASRPCGKAVKERRWKRIKSNIFGIQYLTLSLVPFVFPVFLHEILLKIKHQCQFCILLYLRILKCTKKVEFEADLAEIFKFKHSLIFETGVFIRNYCFLWIWWPCLWIRSPGEFHHLLTDQWQWSIECKTFQIQIALYPPRLKYLHQYKYPLG